MLKSPRGSKDSDPYKGNKLGEGNWGKVLLVTRKDDGKKFACKVLRLSNSLAPRRLQELRDEIRLLSKVDHPFIAKLYETYEDEGLTLYLVMELLSGGELFTRLTVNSPNSRFTEADAQRTTQQMVSSIAYLHSRGIIHRDLKLENFVYREKDGDEVVLIDFGLSAKYNEQTHQNMRDIVGSSYYIAPEVLRRNHGIECDMWSLGVIVFMLLSGSPPFKGDTEKKIMECALSGKFSFAKKPWPSITAEAKDFVTRCLVKDVKLRMTAREALQHPWLLMTYSDELPALGDDVVASLREFSKMAKFKRLALQAVAYSLSHDEITNLEQAFQVVDRDHDGYISVDELQVALGSKVPIVETQFIFDAMDFDHTGKIHFNEFIAGALNESYYHDETVVQHAFDRLDLDNDGLIDADEIRYLLGTNKEKFADHDYVDDVVRDMMSRCDQDTESKGLTPKDFLALMRSMHEKTMNKVKSAVDLNEFVGMLTPADSTAGSTDSTDGDSVDDGNVLLLN